MLQALPQNSTDKKVLLQKQLQNIPKLLPNIKEYWLETTTKVHYAANFPDFYKASKL